MKGGEINCEEEEGKEFASPGRLFEDPHPNLLPTREGAAFRRKQYRGVAEPRLPGGEDRGSVQSFNRLPREEVLHSTARFPSQTRTARPNNPVQAAVRGREFPAASVAGSKFVARRQD